MDVNSASACSDPTTRSQVVVLRKLICEEVDLAGTNVTGLIMERTQSYDVMFVLTGSLILLSAIMCYPLDRVKRWERAQKLKKEAKAALNIEIA